MNLTDNDYELLSAYLDGILADEELHTLEQRLQSEPDLQREFRGLQQTVALVKTLPTLKAPRSFTLTPEMIGQSLPSSNIPELPQQQFTPRNIIKFPALSVLSAVASLILTLAGMGLLLSSLTSGETSSTSATDHQETVAILSNTVPGNEVAVIPTGETELSAVGNLLDRAASGETEIQTSSDPSQEQRQIETAFGYAMTVMPTGAIPAAPQMDSDIPADEQQNQPFSLVPPSSSNDRAANDEFAEEVPAENDAAALSAPLTMQSTLPEAIEGEAVEEMASSDFFDEEAADDFSAGSVLPSPQPTQKPLAATTGGTGGSGGGGPESSQLKPPTPSPSPTTTVTPTITPDLNTAPTAVAMADGAGAEQGQVMRDATDITTESVAENTDIDNQIALGGVLMALGGLMMAFAAFAYLRQRS